MSEWCGQLTVAEILSATTVSYFDEDVSRRAVNEGGGCSYLTEDGRVCGHSLWVRPEFRESCGLNAAGYVIDALGDEVHEPEVRGLDASFWDRLQEIHDGGLHWDGLGVTDLGRYTACAILEQFTK